tara:strand:+ start:158 stop:1060 length:903 start_codon:yes stop_codon:yes gene_type:complete
MGIASELIQAGVKGLKTGTKNFLDSSLSKIDGKSLVNMYQTNPSKFTEYISDVDNYVKTGDENVGYMLLKKTDDWTAQRQQVQTSEAAEAMVYKYDQFQVDESLPLEEQKRIYKKAASDYIYAAEQAEGKTVPVSKFFKEKGKLRVPDEGELDLKWKKKIDGKKDFQPKLKKTTAKETALRKSREKPWITKKSEIEDILKELGQEDKLDQLIKLIRSQYNKKVKQIKASGLSKGHQKSLERGGWDVPENIIGEQGVSTKEVRGNYARQYKEDLPDEELMKQGAFIGTLEEYILMKLKELE